MVIVSIEELLSRASEFEEQLEQYYAAIRDNTEDNGVKLLAYYLSRHRRHLQKTLDDFDSDVVNSIRKELLMFDIEFHTEKHFKMIEAPPDKVLGTELLTWAVEYDEKLVNLYKQILNQPLSSRTKLLFESLIQIEEQDIVMLKKMLAMNYF